VRQPNNVVAEARENKPAKGDLGLEGFRRDGICYQCYAALPPYLPIHEGFNLTFDLSASDLIRTIWAYMNGLREVATQFSTHHLGLLVLDEPKQQSAAAESLAAFLKRTSQSKAANHQVIIATSETLQSLKPMLKGLPVKLIDFSSRVITAKGKK
jgi:hypothetical protein